MAKATGKAINTNIEQRDMIFVKNTNAAGAKSMSCDLIAQHHVNIRSIFNVLEKYWAHDAI